MSALSSASRIRGMERTRPIPTDSDSMDTSYPFAKQKQTGTSLGALHPEHNVSLRTRLNRDSLAAYSGPSSDDARSLESASSFRARDNERQRTSTNVNERQPAPANARLHASDPIGPHHPKIGPN